MVVLFLLFVMFFFMVVQKYPLGGYLNTLALVNLKQSYFINKHKDKLFNAAGNLLFMDPDSPVATISALRGKKGPEIVTIWSPLCFL